MTDAALALDNHSSSCYYISWLPPKEIDDERGKALENVPKRPRSVSARGVPVGFGTQEEEECRRRTGLRE
jgi:hypothetical protein